MGHRDDGWCWCASCRELHVEQEGLISSYISDGKVSPVLFAIYYDLKELRGRIEDLKDMMDEEE